MVLDIGYSRIPENLNAPYWPNHLKNDGVGGPVYSPTYVTSFVREVCAHYTSTFCSPSRLSKGTALVCRVSSQRTLACVD